MTLNLYLKFEFWLFHREDLVHIHQNIPYFNFKKYKKWEIQVIIIMLTRFSERIFNPSHYTGFIPGREMKQIYYVSKINWLPVEQNCIVNITFTLEPTVIPVDLYSRKKMFNIIIYLIILQETGIRSLSDLIFHVISDQR